MRAIYIIVAFKTLCYEPNATCWQAVWTTRRLVGTTTLASPAMGHWGTCPPRLTTVKFF